MLINCGKYILRRVSFRVSQSTVTYANRNVRKIHGLNCTNPLKRNKCFICEPSRDSLTSCIKFQFSVAANETTHQRNFHTTTLSFDEIKTVVVPPFPESVSEGDIRWEKKVGDHIAEDDVVLEIETDKTSVQVPSPCHGVIEELLCEDGATVKAGQQLFRIKVTGQAPEKTASSPAEEKKPISEVKPPVAAAAPTSPIAPQVLPKQPQVADKSAANVSYPRAPKAVPKPERIETASVKVPPADPTKEISGTRSEFRIKMNRMRQRIAQRLKEAQNTNAMLTTFNEIDMSHIMAFRKKNLEQFQKKYGLKLGFMSAFIKASAYALQDQPVVNAVIDDQEIVYRDFVDVSVAVATPKGLVVPVLRNVEAMSYAEIEIGLAALGEKARNGALTVEDMDGGTFTISNGGVFGSLMGTPIINPPQSSILGMHGIFERPIALNGQVVIRPMMYVALTYDHRLIDGREAVMFLRKIKAAVEDPLVILAGL